MSIVTRTLFLMVVVCFFVHELDAIRQHEWRFFFAPVPVDDETAYQLFTALHAPLFILILWFLESSPLRMGLSAFAILHGVLHIFLRNHPLVSFDSWFSRIWIVGGALFGMLHLAFLL